MSDSISNVYARINYLKASFKEYGNNVKPEFINNFNEMLAERSQKVSNTEKNSEVHPLLSSSSLTNEVKIESTPKNSNESAATRIERAIEEASKQYKLSKDLINSVIKQESGFNPNSISRVGAMGLMQLMPDTAKELGVENPFSIEENIDGGVKYLKMMLEKYNGNLDHALAAYNAGPHRVDYAGGVPNIQETQNYVKKIKRNLFK